MIFIVRVFPAVRAFIAIDNLLQLQYYITKIKLLSSSLRVFSNVLTKVHTSTSHQSLHSLFHVQSGRNAHIAWIYNELRNFRPTTFFYLDLAVLMDGFFSYQHNSWRSSRFGWFIELKLNNVEAPRLRVRIVRIVAYFTLLNF